MILLARLRLGAVCTAAAAPLLLAFPQIRYILESRMALHMVLELPLLLVAGWAAAALAKDLAKVGRRYDDLDFHGLLGTALLTSLSLFWMLPVSLDLSLLSIPVQLAKYGSWWLSGMALRRTWPRLVDESLVFFFGMMSWMLATAGMLYQASETRLCVSYLFDDQLVAGRALVVAAVLLGAWALIQLARPRTERARGPAQPEVVCTADDLSIRAGCDTSGSPHQL